MEEIRSQSILVSSYLKGYRVDSKGKCYNPKGQKIRGWEDAQGYLGTTLKFNGIDTHLKFHRLQAYQKYGDKIFNKGIMVRHWDGNKKNNAFYNILIGDNADNSLDKIRHGRTNRGNTWNTKLNKNQVVEIYNSIDSLKELATKFNISQQSVCDIRKGRTWNWLTKNL